MATTKLQQLAQAKLELLKKSAWDNFYIFAKLVCGRDAMEEQPHREVCEFLTLGIDKTATLALNFEAPVSSEFIKECQGKLKKLLMLPRGTFKSTLSSNAFPLWLLWHNPDLRILIDSETLGNAKLYLAGIKDMILNNQLLRLICVDDEGNYLLEPNEKIAGGFTEEQIILKSRKKLGLKEPSIFCAGVDNARTGMHPDVIIMDDLVSERNVGTDSQLIKTKDHYRYSLSLLEPGGLQVVIGTRYHMADLYGELIETDAFEKYIRPAILSDGNLFFPGRLTKEFLNEQMKAQGSYIFSCNPKGAPVLMADWSFKDVSEIKPGDVVMGFERGSRGGGTRAKLIPSKVKACGNRISPVQRVVFEDGTEIRCTPDHKWFTGRYATEKEPYRQEYNTAVVGRKLLSVSQIWREEPSYEDKLAYAYLSAMIDGEGAVKYGSINITQDCALHTGVCRRIEEVLGQLNIPYKLGQYKGTQNTYVLAGGRDVKMKLLRFGCMGKADDVIQNMYTHAGSPVQCENRVVDIIPDGEETVYSFQTETGNYVIWGYMSKNCQYMLSPVDDSSSIFKKNDIQYYAELPKLVAKYITIDLAISQRETADYFVCMVTGVTEDKKLYVVDYTRCRCLPKQQIDIIFETFEKHRELTKSVGIETVAYQKALLYLIKDEMRRRGIYMPLQELKADTDKIRRAQSLQPLFENHEVFIRLNHKELEQELLEFPVGVHDDTVDALAYVLQLLKPGKLSILKRKYAYNLGNRFTGY